MPVIKFELERLLTDKKNLIWLLCLFLITVYFTNLGIIDYRNFFNDKKAFCDFEKKKIKSFVTYGQYYAFGFRLLYEPSKLIVFFRNSNIFQNIESNIDGTEVIKVYNPKKGKFIVNRGYFKDFAGVLFFLGSLYMFYVGSISFRTYPFLKYFISRKHLAASILSRLIMLNLIFMFILLINYLFCIFKGIAFSKIEAGIFASYCIYTLVFLSFFYLAGTFTAAVFKAKKIGAAFIIWIILVLGIPEINNNNLVNRIEKIPTYESLNLKKLSTLMEIEKNTQEKVLQILKGNKDKKEIKKVHKDGALIFFKKVYPANKKIEDEYNRGVSRVIKRYEKESVVIPTSYYRFFTGEISSMGYSGYYDFLNYNARMREDFFQFFFKKRYEVEETHNIESFVKSEENIFKAQSRLPKSFYVGLGFTSLFTILFFAASYFVLSRKLKIKTGIEDPKLKPIDEEGEMYFILCENDKYKNEIYEFYEGDKNTTCIDNIKGKDIDPVISLPRAFDYFCRFEGVEEDRALENLEILGITDISREKKSDESLKKMYCAVCFAKEREKIVIKNFIDRESRDFERKFLDLIEHAQEGDKTVLYLSTQIYYFDSPFTGDIKVNKFKKFKIEKPSAITIR